MICPKCGYEFWSREVVCPNCGSVMPKQTEHVQQPKAPIVDTHALTRSAMKDTVLSGVFLGGVICLSLTFLISMIMAIRGETVQTLNELLLMLNREPLQVGSWTPLQSLLLWFVEQIPAIVLLTALWMIYVGTAVRGVVPKRGVAVLRVALVLDTVHIVLIAIATVCGVWAVSSEAATILLLSGILPAAFTFVILMRVKALQSIVTAQESLITGSPDSEISVALSVFCFVLGGISLLGSLFELDICGILSAVAYILFGIVTVEYRSGMSYVETQLVRTITKPTKPPEEVIPMWKRIQMAQQEQDT